MNWAIAVAGLCALIVVHELGHFVAAKAAGMRVECFSLFFGPELAKIKLGDTEYRLGSIPAGAYVRVSGVHADELAQLDLRQAQRAYWTQTPWKRIAVALAGPLANLLVAFLLFWVVLYSGNLTGAENLATLNPSIPTVVPANRVAYVEDTGPAAPILQPGDRVLAINGHSGSLSSMLDGIDPHRISRSAGRLSEGCQARTPLSLTVRRGRHQTLQSLYPRYRAEEEVMELGFVFGVDAKRFTAAGAVDTTLSEMWHTTAGAVSEFADEISEVVSGSGNSTQTKPQSSKHSREAGGIVGITPTAAQAINQSPGAALVIIGLVSLALAVINLFPFSPLDGGRVVAPLAGKLRGQQLLPTALERANVVGIGVVMIVFVTRLLYDINGL